MGKDLLGRLKMSELRILHLIPDDKFLDGAMQMFEEALPGGSAYFVWNRSSEGEIKYIKSLDRIDKYAPWGSKGAEEVVARCKRGDFDAVILHSWPDWHYAQDLKSSGLPIFMLTWGHEIYGYINQRDYLPETRMAMRRAKSFLVSLREFASCAKRLVLENRFCQTRALKTFLSVDYICPVIEDDYFRLKAKYGRALHAKMLPFSYGAGVDELVVKPLREKTGAVVVGNSETWTNNHIDVFVWLKRLGISNEVIAPISYGNNPVVQGAVLRAGQTILGAQFSPWTKFLPADEYWRRFGAASYLVMGHLRQQGVGNIVVGLALGMKVFLFRANPVYQFLKRNGFAVCAIDETNTAEDFLSPLAVEDIERNRKLLMRIWGHDAILRKIEGILDAVRKRREK